MINPNYENKSYQISEHFNDFTTEDLTQIGKEKTELFKNKFQEYTKLYKKNESVNKDIDLLDKGIKEIRDTIKGIDEKYNSLNTQYEKLKSDQKNLKEELTNVTNSHENLILSQGTFDPAHDAQMNQFLQYTVLMTDNINSLEKEMVNMEKELGTYDKQKEKFTELLNLTHWSQNILNKGIHESKKEAYLSDLQNYKGEKIVDPSSLSTINRFLSKKDVLNDKSKDEITFHGKKIKMLEQVEKDLHRSSSIKINNHLWYDGQANHKEGDEVYQNWLKEFESEGVPFAENLGKLCTQATAATACGHLIERFTDPDVGMTPIYQKYNAFEVIAPKDKKEITINYHFVMGIVDIKEKTNEDAEGVNPHINPYKGYVKTITSITIDNKEELKFIDPNPEIDTTVSSGTITRFYSPAYKTLKEAQNYGIPEKAEPTSKQRRKTLSEKIQEFFSRPPTDLP